MSDLILEPRKATFREKSIARQICCGRKKTINYRETELIKMLMLPSPPGKHSLDTSRNEIWNNPRTKYFLPSSHLIIVI